MKQFESHGVTFFHNSDFSGDIHMQHARGPGFVVPADALKALIVQMVRTDAIATIEHATDDEVLSRVLPPGWVRGTQGGLSCRPFSGRQTECAGCSEQRETGKRVSADSHNPSCVHSE
jgi:hypothetical protein